MSFQQKHSRYSRLPIFFSRCISLKIDGNTMMVWRYKIGEKRQGWIVVSGKNCKNCYGAMWIRSWCAIDRYRWNKEKIFSRDALTSRFEPKRIKKGKCFYSHAFFTQTFLMASHLSFILSFFQLQPSVLRLLLVAVRNGYFCSFTT